jgi:F-box-like
MERLPTELLVDIFTWCTHSAALTAITLGKVCRRWKAITDHSPCLFQLIFLDDHSLTFNLANHLANFYLSRSAGLPFDVNINVVSKDNLLPLLSPFLNHLGRWRSCTIAGAKVENIRFAEFWNRGNGEPKLEELDIAILDQAEIDEMANQIQVQSTAEGNNTNTTPPGTFKPYTISLTSNLLFMAVFLSKLPSPLTLCPLRFVTVSITEAALTLSVPSDDLLRFLTVCPELEFFSFTGTISEPVVTAENIRCPPPIVSLPRLRSLVLHGTLCTRILLSHLHTPALRELYLEHLNVDFEFPVLNPYLPLPSRSPIDSLPSSGTPHTSAEIESATSPSGPLPPPLTEMSLPSPRALAFGFECALEDGDSDDEFADFSQSPHSDHATGMGLRSLLIRSSPPLHVLEMDYADMRTKDFAWLFSRAQSLTDFRIVASDMADRVVRMLAPDESGTLLLPKLRSLELINCQRLSGTAIVDAIRERVRATDIKGRAVDVFPLEDVAVVGCVNFAIDDGLELAEVLGERLRFH